MADRYAKYKGKTYRLAYLGATKFGELGTLAFLDGSKEFWVAASAVTECAAPESSRKGSCPMCGRRNADTYDMEDGIMKCLACCDMPG